MTINEIIKKMTKMSAKAVMIGTVIMVGGTLGGCSIFGGGDDKIANVEAAEEIYQIGVNAYLWRATLDTLSFMPLKTADHNGGLILTEWKINPKDSKERTKVDIFILGKRLSADALKVTVHRQLREGSDWKDQNPRPGAAINIRNAILMQARLLRRDNAPTK